MTKLLVWLIGLIFFSPVALCVLVIYAVWMMLVAVAAVCVLMLKLLGVGVGLGWIASAAGIDQFRKWDARRRVPTAVRPSVQPTLAATPEDIERLRRQAGVGRPHPPSSERPRGSGRSVVD